MRVRITRRGGLAGIALSAELDTASFDKGTATRLEEALQTLVRGGGERATPPHPDAFEYEIVLPEHGESVRVSESDMPPQLQPLLQELTAKGVVGPPQDPNAR
jgi:Emfourin